MKHYLPMKMDAYKAEIEKQEQREFRREAARNLNEKIVASVFWFSLIAFAVVAAWQAPVWTSALRNAWHAWQLGM